MQHLRSGNDVFVRLDEGEEIHASIQSLCVDLSITGAAITSGIGRVREVDFGYLDEGGTYQRQVLREAVELLSVQGNVAMLEGKPFTHIHVVTSDDDHVVHGGHLFSAITLVTGEIHLRILAEGASMPMTRCKLADSQFVPLQLQQEDSV